MLRGSIQRVVIDPAVRGKANPTPEQKFKREKDPFFKNYKRGAQIILRRVAVAV